MLSTVGPVSGRQRLRIFRYKTRREDATMQQHSLYGARPRSLESITDGKRSAPRFVRLLVVDAGRLTI